MPAITVPKTALSFGAGYLYWGAPGTSAPANTSSGASQFSDSWTGLGWVPLGITKEGHTLTIDLNADGIQAAEYADTLLNVITGRTISAAFEMQQIHLTNFRRVFNAPSSNLVTSGSGGSLVTTFTLPSIGSEQRCQLGWESTALDERWWAMQAINVGSVAIQRKRGADNATLPVTFNLEPDATGQPVYFASAGTTRG